MTDLQYLESTCSKKENVDVMPDVTLGKKLKNITPIPT
jgi:hypothetical protein